MANFLSHQNFGNQKNYNSGVQLTNEGSETAKKDMFKATPFTGKDLGSLKDSRFPQMARKLVMSNLSKFGLRIIGFGQFWMG